MGGWGGRKSAAVELGLGGEKNPRRKQKGRRDTKNRGQERGAEVRDEPRRRQMSRWRGTKESDVSVIA